MLAVDCYTNPIIERFLNINIIKDNNTIYNDLHNIHGGDIAKSIK